MPVSPDTPAAQYTISGGVQDSSAKLEDVAVDPAVQGSQHASFLDFDGLSDNGGGR